jgi:ribosome-associated protein
MEVSAISSAKPYQVPEEALSESFIASSGPGGQNVNKVATAVQLRCDLFKLGLSPHVYARLKELAGTRLTSAGEIVITARSYRTQEQNREDARARLAELIAKAHIRKAKRIKTKVSKAAKAKRVEAKTQRGAIKQARAKPRLD